MKIFSHDVQTLLRMPRSFFQEVEGKLGKCCNRPQFFEVEVIEIKGFLNPLQCGLFPYIFNILSGQMFQTANHLASGNIQMLHR
jgi:hypothetical protein